MFIVLSDVLKLLVADGAVKRPKDLRYLSLKSSATRDISLWFTTISYKVCGRDEYAHLPGFPLFLGFVPLTLGIQFTSL